MCTLWGGRHCRLDLVDSVLSPCMLEIARRINYNDCACLFGCCVTQMETLVLCYSTQD